MRSLAARYVRHAWLLAMAVAALVALAPSLGAGPLLQRQLLLAVIYGLLVAGFNLGFGYGGQLALGQVAVFAGGAYAAAILFNHGITELTIAILVAVGVAALLGLITGIPGLRFSAWALALVAFFLVDLVPHVVSLFQGQTGGVIGIPGVIGPTLFGTTLGNRGFYVVSVAIAAVCFLLFRNLVLSRYGHALLVLKQGTPLARSLGLSPFKLRLSAYVIGSLPAGVAGALYAYYSTFVQPDFFSFDVATLLIAVSVVGGITSIWGAPLAAAILVIGPERASVFQKYSVLAYGVILMLAGVGLAGGLAGVGRTLLRRITGGALHAEMDAPAPESAPLSGRSASLAIAGRPLSTTNVSKRFGGVEALRGVDFEAAAGQITGLLGANGAGKTTLLNAISGLYTLDEGEVRLGERKISGLGSDKIARAGVSRTFQTPQVPEELTVLDAVTSSRIAKRWISPLEIAVRAPRYWFSRRDDIARARAALAFVGLGGTEHMLASELPLGRRRLLEVARSIAAEPSVVLLDEPAAGLDPPALESLRSVLDRMREAGATVVLIEHNVPFVLDIADTVFVMDLGSVIARGAPAEIRTNEQVIASYLGRNAARSHGAPAGERSEVRSAV
jgi:ABC-type branched-subunit amino acid transport system ATPase component/ABC-type branched-subunit amino acid transport system permease subunit